MVCVIINMTANMHSERGGKRFRPQRSCQSQVLFLADGLEEETEGLLGERKRAQMGRGSVAASLPLTLPPKVLWAGQPAGVRGVRGRRARQPGEGRWHLSLFPRDTKQGGCEERRTKTQAKKCERTAATGGARGAGRGSPGRREETGRRALMRGPAGGRAGDRAPRAARFEYQALPHSGRR